MPHPPDNLAHQLRAAVLGSDHEKAARLTVEYAAAVREYWIALPPRERAACTAPRQSLELLRWAREMTIMQRGMTGEQLRIVEKSMRYQTARAQYLESAALESR